MPRNINVEDYLKPCPFCGCRKITVDYSASHQSIRCTKCHVSTPLYQDENIAVAAWNRRAEPAVTVIQNGNNNTHIDYVETLNA